jgi:Bacterial Ig-like domain/Calcineurin-like phosphoesterase
VGRSIGEVSMRSMKLGVWVLVGMGLAMLLSVGFLGSEGSISAQDITDPVFVGAGDIASCARTADEATAKLLDHIVAVAPSTTVFTTGDNAYESGTPSEYTNCYQPNWGRHKAITRPTVGNHEYYTLENASGYFGYFGARAGTPPEGYYSYDLGRWHVVALNSMCEKVGGCGAASPMVEWLERDLAANPRTCTLAYFHHPLFSSGSSSGGNSKMRPTWEALYAARADVVLNGHVHNYERFAPQTPRGVADPANGIREFVVGTGGYSLNAFKTTVANSQVRNANSFGVLKLTLHPTGYDWEFVAVDGKTADSGTGSCSSAIPSDTDPPKVVSTIPGANETEVAPAIDVTARFSEAMMDASINGNTFKLLRKEGTTTTKVPATVSYNANIDPLRATLDPNEPLRRGVTYKAVITTGAKDLAGNSLDQSPTAGSQQKAWSFTTSN